MYVESVNGTWSVDQIQVPQYTDKEVGAENISIQPIKQEDMSKEVIERQKEDMEHIREVMQSMQENLPNTDAMFSIHSATNRIMIKLIDRTSHKVVKEVPPEKTLDIIAKCIELSGLMVDKKV